MRQWCHKTKQKVNVMTKVNFVSAWMSDVRGAEYGFFKAVIYALEQFQENNNLPLTAMVAICNGKPFQSYKIVSGDRMSYATPLKRILDKALSDATITFKDGKAKWKVGANGGVNADILAGLRILVAGNPNLRTTSQAFKDAFPKAETMRKVKDAEKVSTAVLKMLIDNGLTLGDVLPVLQAKAVAANLKVEAGF